MGRKGFYANTHFTPKKDSEVGESPPPPPVYLLGLERMLESSSLELSSRMSLEGCVSSRGNRLM